MINERERPAHLGRHDAAVPVCVRMVEEKDHEHARGHEGGDEADGYRLRVDSSEMRVKGVFVASSEMRACGAPT